MANAAYNNPFDNLHNHKLLFAKVKIGRAAGSGDNNRIDSA